MKFRYTFIFILVFFGITTFSFAQVLTQPTTQGTVPASVPNQCGDGSDNDLDGTIDVNGKTINGIVFKADSDCLKPGAVCENGKPNCPAIPVSTPPPTTGSGLTLNVKLINPLKVDSIQGAIKLFMDTVLKIILPIIVIFFIWSGLNFVLARGRPEQIKKAKNMFLYTVIGTLLILGAWTITNAIIGTVNTLTN